MSTAIQVHYSNTYAEVVEAVASIGAATVPDVAEAVGIGYGTASQYLSRAVARGHVFRTGRGVYEVSEGETPSHPHYVCATCGTAAPIANGRRA